MRLCATPSPPIPSFGDFRSNDDILQLYTSGTTGLPKGVRLDNANYPAFLELQHRRSRASTTAADDTVLIVMPLFHVAGTNISFCGAGGQGGRVIIAAGVRARRLCWT